MQALGGSLAAMVRPQLHDRLIAQTTGTVIRATSKFSARRSRKQWRSRGRSRRQTRKETTQQ
jgi:hypothetical protein